MRGGEFLDEIKMQENERLNAAEEGKPIRIWELWRFATVSILGTLLHFLYEWLKEPIWIAPFSGVNESTWEHMKLLFWPIMFFACVQGIFFSQHKGFACIKLRSTLIGLSLIPLLFYSYNGVMGKSPDWINIAIFFISAAIAYAYEAVALYGKCSGRCNSKLAVGLLLAVAVLFTVFTFCPPEIAIFRDPVSGNFGI